MRLFRTWSFGPSTATAVDKEEDLPDVSEVRSLLELFKDYNIGFNEGKDQVEEIVNDGDLECKKVDYDVITSEIMPQVDAILNQMIRAADQFKKWKKLKMNTEEG